MNKSRLIARVTVGILAIAFLLSCTMPVCATQSKKQVVKVAYYNMGNYYNEISDGVIRSYDTEALAKIESYSNLQFEYVNCYTWANALKMLQNHEVELVGTMQWTYEREEQYEFCLQSYGYTVGELVGLSNRNFIYEDYDTIATCVIGCTKDYVRLNEIKSIFKKHHINPKIKTYSEQLGLENALENGEIDLIAANSHTLREEWTVVEKFSYAPFYLASWKDNEQLTNQIDDAIISINLSEPSWDDDLLKKYFPSIVGTPLTKEEMDLISQRKSYDVYFDANTRPTSWYDENTKELKGALVEVCNQVSKSTGLRINPIPNFEGKTKFNSTSNKTTTLFNGKLENDRDNKNITQALINESFNLYYKSTTKIDLSKDKYSIAIVFGRNNLKEYLQNNYPNASIKEYTTPKKCLNAVNDQQTDLAYLDCRIAENQISENGFDSIREFPIENSIQGISIIFSGENSELLTSIFNKGLEQVDYNVINDLFIQYALDTKEPVTIKTILRDHLGLVVGGISFIVLLVIGIAILITYAKVMRKQKVKIEKANADKTEFFSRMSHDMRTPMNGILGMIRLSKDSNSIQEIHENIVKAEDAGEYMLSLINDTLDLQRLETKKLQLKKDVVNVEEYYNSIFSILKISAEQKNLDFRVKYIDIDMDNYIVLDSVRVKQILSNLVSNAIKFTPEGGTIEVTVATLGQDGAILHRKYQVKDTGVGMSEEFLKTRLFKPYSQENNELSSQLTGTGLGMAITKNLIELMGGRLEVESSLGEGTTFTAIFDIERATKEDVEREKKEKDKKEKAIISDLEGKRILLCEDHPLNAEIAIRLLNKVGCEIVWAQNGKKGVEAFVNSELLHFDVILMDIRMPIMDGITATKEIRTLDRDDAKTIPILAMTANAYDSDIKNCLEAGMNAHIPKPIEPQQLYFKIHQYTHND